jgi:signal transduction histidine kinase
VRTSQSDGRVRAEVRDGGPGVPLGERSRLFSEYSQISNPPTGGEDSTGLGLSIVKQLVESERGMVGADFPSEGGSVFWFEVPVAPGT